MIDQAPRSKPIFYDSMVVVCYFFSFLLVITGAVFFYEEFDRGLTASKWIGLPLTDEMKRFESSVHLAGWIWKLTLLLALLVLPRFKKAKTGNSVPPAMFMYTFDHSKPLPTWLAYDLRFLIILAVTFMLVIAMFTFRNSPFVQKCQADAGMVLDHFAQKR